MRAAPQGARELPTRALGDLRVSALGMGAMTLTQLPDSDLARGERAVHAALDAGITLFDTADSYGPSSEMGLNEAALVRALRQVPGALERVVIATKGGHTRGPNATWWIDGSPAYLAAAARASLARLGLDELPLYQHHRPDPRVRLPAAPRIRWARCASSWTTGSCGESVSRTSTSRSSRSRGASSATRS